MKNNTLETLAVAIEQGSFRIAEVEVGQLKQYSDPIAPPNVAQMMYLLGKTDGVTNVDTRAPDIGAIGFKIHGSEVNGTIYVKYGDFTYAIVNNWDANPDGINRFLKVFALEALIYVKDSSEFDINNLSFTAALYRTAFTKTILTNRELEL